MYVWRCHDTLYVRQKLVNKISYLTEFKMTS
jgi:hypothetical protein